MSLKADEVAEFSKGRPDTLAAMSHAKRKLSIWRGWGFKEDYRAVVETS